MQFNFNLVVKNEGFFPYNWQELAKEDEVESYKLECEKCLKNVKNVKCELECKKFC